MQQHAWEDASDNKHIEQLKIAHPANKSTVDDPKFLVTGLNADTHGTSRQQLQHIVKAFYSALNNQLHTSYQFDDV